MNKKIFIGIMMFSFMLMGTSFAKWNDGFVVSGTVSSGYLDIQASPGCISQPIYMEPNINSVSDSENLEIVISNFYLDAVIDFDFSVRNVGTLGIILDAIAFKIENGTSDDLEDYIMIELSTDGITYMRLENIESDLKTQILGVGESITFYGRIVFDPDNRLEAGDYENENIRYTLEINYKQFNAVD